MYVTEPAQAGSIVCVQSPFSMYFVSKAGSYELIGLTLLKFLRI